MRYLYALVTTLSLWASAWAQTPKSRQQPAVTTLSQPVALPATQISDGAFTANWQPVEGAVGYCVYAYVKTEVEADGEYSIIDEDFTGITNGSIIEPAGGDELYVELDAYTSLPGWSAYAFPTFIPSMVDGLVYSPYLDLRNDDGRYRIVVTVYANQGDEIRVETNGRYGKEAKSFFAQVTDGAQGMCTDTLEFDNGTRDLFFSIINLTAELGTPDYVDRVQVLQNLKEGDVVFTQVALNEGVDAEDDWGYDVTSIRFNDLHFAYGEKQLYYDLYAAAYDWSTPNGSMPYTAIYSPYSEMVLVDLEHHTSVLGVEEVAATSHTANSDAWYTLGGQRVSRPTKGLYIHNGIKIFVK